MELDIEVMARALCSGVLCHKHHTYWTKPHVRVAGEFPMGTSAELVYDLPEGWVEEEGYLYCSNCVNERDA